MTVPIPEAFARIVAMCKDVMTELSETADAYPYFNHFQEAFPYFTMRVGATTFGDDGSEDFDEDTYPIIIRLVIGHITEGYSGEREADLITWIPYIKTYFHEREGLQHETNSTTYDETAWLRDLVRARMTDSTGLRIFQNAGTSTLQIGVEFTVTCEFNETINPEYA